MVIDTRMCVGCMDCVVACQTENDVPAGYCRDWITTDVRGQFPEVSMEIRSERCNHCDNPPCVSCCPTGASHVEDFTHGVVDTRQVFFYLTGATLSLILSILGVEARILNS